MAEASDAKKRVLDFIKGSGGEPSRLWIAAALLLVVIVGFRSCASVEAGQVAVRINNITGSTEVITQPGLILKLPGIHNVYLLDVSPQTFHLCGAVNKGALEGKEL